MSNPNKEIAAGGPGGSLFTGRPTRRDCQIVKKREVLGVCLIAKRLHGLYKGFCSGCVVEVSNLFPNWKRKVCVITHEQIDCSKKQDYRLYFEELSGDGKKKFYELKDVTSSKDTIKYCLGLAIIPLDDNKLTKFLGLKKCGVLTYRPFPVNKEESFDGSVCYIVDGNPQVFTVKSYVLKYVNKECILELPERGEQDSIFKTFSQLTAQGSNNLHPNGAVVLKMVKTAVKKTVVAVGALSFVKGKISPVSFSQLTEIADGGRASTSQRREDQRNTLEGLSDESCTSHQGRGKRQVNSKPTVLLDGKTASRSWKREKQKNALEDLSNEYTSHLHPYQEEPQRRPVLEQAAEAATRSTTPKFNVSVTECTGPVAIGECPSITIGDSSKHEGPQRRPVLEQAAEAATSKGPQHRPVLEQAAEAATSSTTSKYDVRVTGCTGPLAIGQCPSITTGDSSKYEGPQRRPVLEQAAEAETSSEVELEDEDEDDGRRRSRSC